MSEDPAYILHFEWPAAVTGNANRGAELYAETEEHARLQAALLYAGSSFDEPVPTAYRIVARGGAVIYRYPESFDEPRTWPVDVPLPGTR